jgi:type I restriction enzyme S subunit
MIAEQLKKSILQAAIQGKLTQQLPEDGDARDLLKDIQKEKARLIKEGKIKKEKPLPEITEDEIPFEIPENWCWVRLGEIGQIVGGGTPRTEDKLCWRNGEIPWLTPADMKNIEGKYVSHGERYITEYGLKHSSTQLMPGGAILFSSRAPIGYIAIANNDITTNQGFKSIVPHIFKMSEFIYYYLMTITPEIEKMGSGTTFKEVSGTVMKKVSIPLPPLNEQQRIVERIEELLPEIQSLKNDEAKLEELQKSFPKKMKDAILQYAIQGKLTQQLAEDGDARDLLKDIQKEKARLIKEGKIKKEKPLPEITEDEIPFEIPENWCWVRLGEIVLQNLGGGTPSKSNPDYWNGGIPWASVKDLNCKFLDSTQDNISRDGLKNSSSNLIPAGNLIACTRMGLGKIVYNSIDVAINQDLRALILSKIINKWYVYYFYLTLNFNGKGATVKGISIESLSNALLPLPTLKEQKRIVKRIEELLPLCEELK